MELHSPYRTAVDALDGFHDGVGGGPGGHFEARGYVLGRLVVGGVDHICSGAGYVSEPRAFYRVDGVNGPEVGEGLVVVGLRRFLCGDVLVEGTSEGYVDQLLSPADSQYGHIPLKRGVKQQPFHCIPFRNASSALRDGCFSVKRGGNVVAAGKDKSVQTVQEFWNVRLTYRIEPQVEMVSGERNNNPLKFVVTSYVRDKEARG